MTEACMSAYDILREYRHIVAREAELVERIRDCWDAATRATAATDASGGSGSSERSRLETAGVRAIDLEAQLKQTIEGERSQRIRIQGAINRVENVELRRLLELRYIDGRMWEDVNVRLHISRSTSRRWHHEALEDFWAAYETAHHGASE